MNAWYRAPAPTKKKSMDFLELSISSSKNLWSFSCGYT